MKILKIPTDKSLLFILVNFCQLEFSIFSFLKEFFFFLTKTFLYSRNILFPLFNILYIKHVKKLQTYIIDKIRSRRISSKVIKCPRRISSKVIKCPSPSLQEICPVQKKHPKLKFIFFKYIIIYIVLGHEGSLLSLLCPPLPLVYFSKLRECYG